MLTFLFQKLDQGARDLTPLLTTLLFLFGGIVPWPVPYLGAISPALVLITLYYWAVYRPDLFHPHTAFFVGLLNDAVNGLPMGLSAFIFVGLHQMALAQRRIFVGHSFLMFWCGFALTALVAMIIQWIIFAMLQGHIAPLLPVLLQTGLTIALFPLLAWGLMRLQRLLFVVE